MPLTLITCRRCEAECEKRSPSQMYCDPCRVITEREKSTERARRRRQGQARPKSALIQCHRCGCAMESRGGRHLYCDPCRKVVSNEANKAAQCKKRRAAGIEGFGAPRPCEICGATFSLKNGQQRYCEPCSDARKKEIKTQINIRYRERHGERIREKERQWREGNAETVKDRQEHYKKRNPHARKISYSRYYQSKKNDPTFALNYRMRHSIWLSLKEQKQGQSWEELIGYTVDDLRVHLERQFLPGMSWDNMGEWHIDHVLPLALHKFESPDDPEFKAAWSLPNLRPLWAEDNLKKNAKRLTLL